MGRVEYTVGDAANAFPQPGQFKAFFSSFMTRAKQKGSVYIAGENQRWFTDAAFTSPASFPSGQSGEIYTVYCKLTNNLTIFSIVNNAEDVPYQTITSYQQPRLSIWNYSGPDGREGSNQLGQALKMMIEKQNADGTWSLVPTCKTDYDGTEWYDTAFFYNTSENGVYRLKCLRYTATDNSGAVLYYDDATDPTNSRYTVNILPQELTITDVIAMDRQASDSVEASLKGGALHGVLAQDKEKVGFTLGVGTMRDAAVGENKAVTANIQLTGEKAGNYTLVQPTDITVNITAVNSSAERLPQTGDRNPLGLWIALLLCSVLTTTFLAYTKHREESR